MCTAIIILFLQVEDYRFQCDEMRVKLDALSQQTGAADLEVKVRTLGDELSQVRSDNQNKFEVLQQDLDTAAEKLNEQKKK